MNMSTISANKKAWKNQSGPEYAKMHREIKAEAQRIDGTQEDGDSRDNFVELREDSQLSPGAYVSLYGENKEFANVTLRAASYKEEAHPSDEDSILATQKDRFLELRDVPGRDMLEVSDSFSQSVTRHFEVDLNCHDEELWSDNGTRVAVFEASTGEELAGPGADLLLGSGWSKEQFQAFMEENA